MTTDPPTWDANELEEQRQRAIQLFRDERLDEPVEAYHEKLDILRGYVEDLLELSQDLAQLRDVAVDVLTDENLKHAARYLAGPPISDDDLKTLADASSLAPSSLSADPEMALRVIQTILAGLDRRRFVWVSEDRPPQEAERAAATLATAAMQAYQAVLTDRRTVSSQEQEAAVKSALRLIGFREVASREIDRVTDAPARGEFCGESQVCGTKADVVVTLWDGRVMPTECKVSNSAVNSYKRLVHEAGGKGAHWSRELGPVHTVPTAVLSGVYQLRNLLDAQQNLTIFWAHDLDELTTFVEATRP